MTAGSWRGGLKRTRACKRRCVRRSEGAAGPALAHASLVRGQLTSRKRADLTLRLKNTDRWRRYQYDEGSRSIRTLIPRGMMLPSDSVRGSAGGPGRSGTIAAQRGGGTRLVLGAVLAGLLLPAPGSCAQQGDDRRAERQKMVRE